MFACLPFCVHISEGDDRYPDLISMGSMFFYEIAYVASILKSSTGAAYLERLMMSFPEKLSIKSALH